MLHPISLVVFGLIALAGHIPRARADSVGVVVTGEVALQPPLAAQIEGWLRGHGYEVAAVALNTSETTRLIDCFTVDDAACARKVVEAKARSHGVVFARVAREGKTINLTIHWLVKGRPPVGGRRGCEPCTTDVLRGASDELLASLASAATGATGRLRLTSKPDGLIVMLDGFKIGVTPLERELAAGTHSIILVSGGSQVGKRDVGIAAGGTAEVAIEAVYPPEMRVVRPRSRLLPIVLLSTGGAAIAGGLFGLYLGQKGGHDDPYIYRGATPGGIAALSAGAVAIGAGVWLWWRGSREAREPVPVATVLPGGGYLGWQGRF